MCVYLGEEKKKYIKINLVKYKRFLLFVRSFNRSIDRSLFRLLDEFDLLDICALHLKKRLPFQKVVVLK